MKKNRLFFSILILWLSIIPQTIKAASFGMSASTSQVAPYGSFIVNVGGDSIGRVNLSVSNGSLSTSSVWVEQGYARVYVTAAGSGTVTVTASPTAGFSDADANPYNPGSRSVSVRIVTPSSSSGSSTPSYGNQNTTRPSTAGQKKQTNETTNNEPEEIKSANNNLSSLTIKEGKLSPNFEASQTEYTVKLKANVTAITLTASAEDGKAKIEGLGAKTVYPGNNDIEVVVIAENGDRKTYKIKAYVDETPQVYFPYNGKKIGIIRNYLGVKIPENFTKTKQKLGKNDFLVFNKGKLNIVYGQDEKKNKQFYLFDSKQNKIISTFTPISIKGKTIYVLDNKAKYANTVKAKIKINDNKLNCYKFKKNNAYYLLHTINEKGKEIAYLYETSENTIQLYPEFLTNKKKIKTQRNIIYILCISIFLLIGANIYQIQKYKVQKTKKENANEKKTTKTDKQKPSTQKSNKGNKNANHNKQKKKNTNKK